MMAGVEKAVAAFLGDPIAVCLGICGEVGSGKLYAVESVAKGRGWSHQVVDRSQGAIVWNRFGQYTLGGNGLMASLYIVCNAKESNWDFLETLKGKFVFIANDEQDLAPLKRWKIAIEKKKRPTVEQMTKALFLEHDVPVGKAKRLSEFAQGDWRRVWTLEKLFREAGIDLETANGLDFQAALATMAKDRVRDIHPTLKVHQLFSGRGFHDLESDIDAETLVWGQANLGVVCGNVADMALLAEVAATSDFLTSECDGGSARCLGFDHFARSARSITAGDALGYYDYKKFRNPYTTDAKSVAAIKDSFDKTMRSSTCRLKRLPQEQGGVEEIGSEQMRPRGKAKAKATPTSKAKVQKTKVAKAKA